MHENESRSVVFNSLWPHRLYSPWNSPGQNTGVSSLSLLQGIFPAQGSNFRLLQLLHWQWILYHSTIWEAYKSLYLPSSPVLAILLVMGPHFEWQGSRVSLIAQLVKNSPAMQDLIPGLGRFPGEGKGYPLQYPGLENSMDCIVYGVTKSRAWLSDFHFHRKLHPANVCARDKVSGWAL